MYKVTTNITTYFGSSNTIITNSGQRQFPTTMSEVEDELRPSKSDIDRVYSQTSQKWSSYAKDSYHEREFAPDTLHLPNMLGKIPSYPGHNISGTQARKEKLEFDLYTRSFPGYPSTLFVKGISLWNVGDADCDLREKTLSHQILLGVQKPVSCSFWTDGRFENWSGHSSTHPRDGNCLAILVFAWSYILSARWVEIQKASGSDYVQDRIIYLPCQAGWRHDANESLPGTIDINLGDVSICAARWWTAILAKEEGWRAEINRDDAVYQSPWSTAFVAADFQFSLMGTNNSHSCIDAVCLPPTSEVALGYLIEFCCLHNAGSQCSAALAAALTLPSAGNASLPLPTSHASSLLAQQLKSDGSFSTARHLKYREGTLADFELLPYYMTLSCSGRGIEALLCNTFFNPHVPCNLVSAWIQPIFEVLNPIIAAKDYDVLAMILGKAKPNIAALWVGALITGMAHPVIQRCRNGSITIEIHSSAWTNTTQTFMSLNPQRLPNSDRIGRPEECRLLYLAGEELNSRLPICPWSPVGTTMLSETDICVRVHAHCTGGHYLRYDSWFWSLKNGGKAQEVGFSGYETTENIIPIPEDSPDPCTHIQDPKDVAEDISMMTTRSIFSWLRSYGWPATEKAICNHSWIYLDCSDSEDESEVDPEDDVSDPGKVKYSSAKMERIVVWLDQSELES
ncbi:hypothetical protein HYFRA_00002466 [Hymenoscyphus fraxineus]|uniref:Uncharacterized protein n=1 Tax=Hymenoscyphus fraxineus TaxID=746836 RepID=A0A9N9LAG9_9HELO|nr:hypothetical protein HYFRA_00002466 [Hymenoscyphus fraxineus]